MSFLSGLKVFGKDIVKVFAWTGSPKGQAVIGTAEGLIEEAAPVTIPIVNLFNAWAQKAYAVESLAVAAGQAQGTGPQKAELAISTITPEVLKYAKDEGLSPRTADQITRANNALVAFIKAMTEDAPAAPAA